jgi:dynein heavy chain
MAKLKFKQDDKGNDTKISQGMYSKDGEYVTFDAECDLGGQVCHIEVSAYMYLYR